MSDAERRYSVTDQEWLAVADSATRHWRHLLKGIKFMLRTDHSPLRQLLRTKGEDFSNRQLRWFERLNEFCFEVEHLPGQNNKVADALSRAYMISAIEVHREEQRQTRLGLQDVIEASQQDVQYQQLIDNVKKESNSSWTITLSGLLEDGGGRLLVPNNLILKTKIILEAHEPAFAGHFGVKRTKELIKRNWKWESLNEDVDRVIGSCDICQRAKTVSKRNEAPIELMIAEYPWEMVTLDFLSGFIPSIPGRWEGCVVVCDRFSKMMHVKECSVHPTAKEAALLFLQLVFRAHGLPRCILSDRGSQFDSLLWKSMIDKLGTRVKSASTHYPQTNGLTERMNRTLIGLVRKVCAQQKEKWVEALPLLEFAYNNSIHSTTGVSPFCALQGQNPIIPAALLVPRVLNAPPPKEYADELIARLKKIWKSVQEA